MDDELLSERRHLDAAYARLRELQDLAKRFAAEAYHRDEDYVVDSLFERDVVAAQAGHRIAALDVPKGRMAVGRLDRVDGEVHYIGRLAIADAEGDPMIIDWRAPVAEAFYRAVPADPMGVVRRRHLRWRGDELVGLDDEVLDAHAAATSGLGLVGEGALMAALTAPRTGRMTDVVATIQAEQDRIIRRPRAGALVVQGAPGTGKTAVALHRAAYLLYTDRHTLGETSILFVGPNPTFLRYVEEVVPSLGEDRVVLATPTDLGPPVEVTRTDTADAARIKGDARMADVIAAAVRDRERAPREELTVPCGRFVLHLPVDALKRIVVRARRTEGTHNGRRRIVERLVVELLQQTFDEIVEKQKQLRMLAAQSDFRPVTDLLEPGAVKRVADRLWPVLTPELLLGALYAGPKRRARVCRDLLTDDEQALLQRDVDDTSWSDADVALLDEAATLLGTVPARKPRSRVAENIDDAMVERVMADTVDIPDCPVCGSELTFEPRGGSPGDAVFRCDVCEPRRYYPAGDLVGDSNAQLIATVFASLTTRHMVEAKANLRVGDLTYGHVVVDEAQDLSPMQWRALVRRCPTRSMTVVGDQGQAIRPGGVGSWEAAMEAAGASTFDLAELTVNYRTPVEVMEAAEAVLAGAGVRFSRTRSVRSTQAPVVHDVDDVTPEVVQRIVDGLDVDGTHAVIAPSARCEELGAIDVIEAKGLEFDAVVVVDPDTIAAEGEGGARRVYVAMTRTTNALHVVRRR